MGDELMKNSTSCAEPQTAIPSAHLRTSHIRIRPVDIYCTNVFSHQGPKVASSKYSVNCANGMRVQYILNATYCPTSSLGRNAYTGSSFTEHIYR